MMATMRTAMIISPVEGGIVLTGCSQGHLARLAGQHYDDYGDNDEDDFSMVMMLRKTIMSMKMTSPRIPTLMFLIITT